MEELRGSSFRLIENPDGHVKGNTVMKFDDSSNPNIATYSGPNIIFGQVIIFNGMMLYQALETGGKLCAGKAMVNHKKSQ